MIKKIKRIKNEKWLIEKIGKVKITIEWADYEIKRLIQRLNDKTWLTENIK